MLQYIKIGDINLGIDGVDSYYQITSLDDIVSYEHIYDEVMSKFWNSGNGSGTYFCTSCRVILDPIHDSKAIVIVQHRYDI